MKKLLILLMCCLLLTACGQQKEVTGNTESNPTTENQNPESQPTPPEGSDSSESEETTEAPTSEPQPIMIQIYMPNENYDGFISVNMESDELSETIIVNKLIEAGVLNDGTAINSLTIEDAVLTIDFNAEFGDLIMSQGSTGERMVMGCVVNTFLRAYNAESVLITVDGEILESGHVVYDFPMSFFE